MISKKQRYGLLGLGLAAILAVQIFKSLSQDASVAPVLMNHDAGGLHDQHDISQLSNSPTPVGDTQSIPLRSNTKDLNRWSWLRNVDVLRKRSSSEFSSGSHSSGDATSINSLYEEKALLMAKLKELDIRIKLQEHQQVTASVASKATKLTATLATSAANVRRDHDRNPVRPTPSMTEYSQRNRRSDVSCRYDFKVYVYEIPQSLPSVYLAHQSRQNKSLHICQKCILEQFSLEYIALDFFTQFCGRTYNPDEADYFYLPIVRDAEYRMALATNFRQRAPSQTEQALIDIIEKNDSSTWKRAFNITDRYWWAHGGADHIIVMPAPVTNLRHESSMRGYYHYMSHLHNPIFMGVEYSLSFVEEYPVCSVQKNIVVPYPTTDPDFYNGRLFDPKIQRTSLIFYAGGLHGDCVEVRKAMKQLMTNSTKLPGVVPHVRRVMAEREHGFLSSIFCPIPVGDSPSSKRMYDVMNFGCIPVVLSDDLVWAFSDQTFGPTRYRNFSIHLPQHVIQYTSATLLRKWRSKKAQFGSLPSGVLLYDLLEDSYKNDPEFIDGIYVNPLVKILQRIPHDDVARLQAGVLSAAPFFQFYARNSSMTSIPTSTYTFPDGGAIDMIAGSLAHRKEIGIDTIRHDCIVEKSRHHKYDSRYPCDRSPAKPVKYRRFI